jgi:sugar phosphate isomerase/epimerase
MQIALNTYSLRKEWKFFSQKEWAPFFKMAEMVGIKQVEVLDRHFLGEDMKNLRERMASHGMKIFSIGPHPCFLTNPANFQTRIAEGKKWVDFCADNEIPYFRVSIGGGKYDPATETPKSVTEAVEWAAEVFGPVVTYAESRGVTPCIETHHKYSSNPEWQGPLYDRIASKNLGFAYDIGNFENDTLRWASLDALLKRNAIRYVHAKSYAYTNQGFETTLDYPRAIKQMMDAGLDIPLSIEWEGRLIGPQGVIRTNEICKYSIAKAQGKTYQMQTSLPSKSTLKKQLLA